MSSKDTDEEPLMHSKSGNIETKINDRADEVFKILLNHFFLDFKYC